MSEQNQQRSINLELSEQAGEGIYANLALITHSSSEFVIDFARLMPGLPKARIQARIIMTPQNLKNLQRAIVDNIAKYEAQFGQIKLTGHSTPTVNFEEPLADDTKKVH
ncbi:MAG TPA: DUF3467 domain-containing protein [Candidatus Glassbacteria bacterium]|nr:DUF3467 domain-containing protein [Candidatus Glassbacteria bacterium]